MKKVKHSINLKIPQELNLEIDKILINKRVEEPEKTHRKQDLILDLLIEGARICRQKKPVKFFRRR